MAGSDERIEEESIRRKRERERSERMGNKEGSLVGRDPPYYPYQHERWEGREKEKRAKG